MKWIILEPAFSLISFCFALFRTDRTNVRREIETTKRWKKLGYATTNEDYYLNEWLKHFLLNFVKMFLALNLLLLVLYYGFSR